MILTQADLDEFSRAYGKYSGYGGNEQLLAWLADHPQVLVASGYQEFVAPGNSAAYRSLVSDGELDDLMRPILKQFDGSWVVPSFIGPHKLEEWEGFKLEDLIRVSAMTKALHEVLDQLPQSERDRRREVIDLESRDSLIEMPSYNTVFERAKKFVDNPLVDPTVWVSPRLWTPRQQEAEKLHLQRAAGAIISQLQSDELTLVDLHWRQLEELVAELLRSLGLEIHLVKENPQGGRDIIARAPMVEGLHFGTIAVEVKHRDVVDRPIVQQAIMQNSHFPTLMLVTSGRFTAGVIQEVSKPENRMRIALKDGIAIRDMIRSYRLKA